MLTIKHAALKLGFNLIQEQLGVGPSFSAETVQKQEKPAAANTRDRTAKIVPPKIISTR